MVGHFLILFMDSEYQKMVAAYEGKSTIAPQEENSSDYDDLDFGDESEEEEDYEDWDEDAYERGDYNEEEETPSKSEYQVALEAYQFANQGEIVLAPTKKYNTSIALSYLRYKILTNK